MMESKAWKITTAILIVFILFLGYGVYTVDQENTALFTELHSDDPTYQRSNGHTGFANILWTWSYLDITDAVKIGTEWVAGNLSDVVTLNLHIKLYDQDTNQSTYLIVDLPSFNGSQVFQTISNHTYNVIFRITIENQEFMHYAYYDTIVYVWEK